MKKRLFCASSSIRVVYSERTSSTSRLQQTTWSQSTDRFEFVCPDRRQDYGVHNVVPIDWRSIPTRGWSFTNLRRSPSTSEIATRGPNRRTDRRQNRCTTWSRSTQKLSDRPASLEKVEASDRHQDYGAQRGPDWRGIPTRGWSFACLRRFRFEFCNCTQLILLWEFIADIDCVCFLLQQFSAKLLGQTLYNFPGRILQDFPGRTLKTFSRSNFASRSFFLICRSFFLIYRSFFLICTA